jgi:Zn-dependent membrane protease YugP
MELEIAIAIVGLLIFIVSIVSGVVSIWLAICYAKFNKKENTAGLTGEQVARKILDDNGLNHIKVSVTGSIMFGNSYSHYFKKVRLRRMTRHETSLTALGMGAQKAALAVLAKEGDPDMKRQIRLVPLITFGPFAFIPLILVGVALDLYVFNQSGTCTMILGGLGLLFYIYSIVLSITTLKTEKKAQVRANEILTEQGLITAEELEKIPEMGENYSENCLEKFRCIARKEHNCAPYTNETSADPPENLMRKRQGRDFIECFFH